MYRTLPLLLTLIPAFARADEPEPTAPPAAPAGPPPGAAERPYDHEISFRGRMLTVPDGLLDIWYYNEKEEGWAIPGKSRPDPRGYMLGLEYVYKSKKGANGIFYFDYGASTMAEGYWDDREGSTSPDHSDGSYVVPSPGFSVFMAGADFGYEAHIVRTEKTNGAFGLSLMPGGGLGVLFVSGNLEEWTPCPTNGYVTPGDCGNVGDPAYVVHANGRPSSSTVQIPKVLPVVDINLALRFNFGNRVVLRVEGGLHNLLYYGATLGLMF